MAVYTRYAQVLDAAGNPLTVRNTLALINQTLDEALAEQEGDFEADTRWAVAWFEHQASTKVNTAWPRRSPRPRTPASPAWWLRASSSPGAGKVRLLRPEQIAPHPGIGPATSASRPGRQCTISSGCWKAAASVQRRMAPRWVARPRSPASLAYRLYTVCERKKRAVGGAGVQWTGAKLAGDWTIWLTLGTQGRNLEPELYDGK